jgi:hypothetical protein
MCAVACSAPAAPPAQPKGALRALAPSGTTSWPFEFRWEGVRADSIVRIAVTDEAERLLHEIEARGDRAPAPDALRRLLTPGTTYFWRVARLDENGQESDASELTRFRVK